MSSALRRILAAVLVLVLLCGSLAYAESATIISPAQNTVTTSSSLLVSVKLTEPVTIRVTVYGEKISKTAQDGTSEYVPVDVAAFTSEDLGKIADVYAGKEAQTLSNGETAVRYTSVVYSEAATYTNSSDMSFYTKQISEVASGLYRVCVETLGEKDAVVETQNSFVAVQEKPEETPINLFESKATNAFKTIQNMLRSIFK